MRGRRRKDQDGKTRLPVLSDFAAVEIFVAVMETRSVTKAATRLNTVPSAISHRLSNLEKLADIKLFNRTTRSLSPTEAGTRLYERCKEIIRSIDVAEKELWGADTHLVGDLRISAPVYFGMSTIAPILPEFVRLYPDLRVTIKLSALEQDLVTEGFDLAIRLQKNASPEKGEFALMENTRVFCASPDYLARHGVPDTPAELEEHDCLAAFSTSPFVHWPCSNGNGIDTVRVHPVLLSDNVMVLIEGARQGLGIAFLGTRAISPWLASGELVTVLDAFAPPPNMLVATTPDTMYMPKKVKVFVDFLASKLADPNDTTA